ncbi:MAG TPA: energy-coupling factor ABC transporter permease [Ramlibacter sp.]
MTSRAAFEVLLLALAWAATLAVRPWRLLRPHEGRVPLATPFLACLTVLPWLWSWPGLAALPIPLHWSGAPLVVLLLGWPLAVPVITLAGLATLFTAGHGLAQALSLTVWTGLVPATLVLAMGYGVRKAFGPNPVAYMLGRAFFVPMLALGACGLAAALLADGLAGSTGGLQKVAIALLAMGEASWTCAIVSFLVAYRPQWLATWSDAMYRGRPARKPAAARVPVPAPARIAPPPPSPPR